MRVSNMETARITRQLASYKASQCVPQRIECGWETMHAIRGEFGDGLYLIDTYAGLPIEMIEQLPPRAFEIVLHSGERERFFL